MPLINFSIEVIALADLITDGFITMQLIKSPNTGWATITLISMLAPQLISSNQLISHLLDKLQSKNESESYLILKLIASLSVTPIFLVIQFVMDLWYVISSTLLEPIAKLCGFNCLQNCINNLFSSIF